MEMVIRAITKAYVVSLLGIQGNFSRVFRKTGNWFEKGWKKPQLCESGFQIGYHCLPHHFKNNKISFMKSARKIWKKLFSCQHGWSLFCVKVFTVTPQTIFLIFPHSVISCSNLELLTKNSNNKGSIVSCGDDNGNLKHRIIARQVEF